MSLVVVLQSNMVNILLTISIKVNNAPNCPNRSEHRGRDYEECKTDPRLLELAPGLGLGFNRKQRLNFLLPGNGREISMSYKRSPQGGRFCFARCLRRSGGVCRAAPGVTKSGG